MYGNMDYVDCCLKVRFGDVIMLILAQLAPGAP
jgi:hypothetical protein